MSRELVSVSNYDRNFQRMRRWGDMALLHPLQDTISWDRWIVDHAWAYNMVAGDMDPLTEQKTFSVEAGILGYATGNLYLLRLAGEWSMDDMVTATLADPVPSRLPLHCRWADFPSLPQVIFSGDLVLRGVVSSRRDPLGREGTSVTAIYAPGNTQDWRLYT